MLPSNISFPAAQSTSLQHLNSRADTSVASLQWLQVHLYKIRLVNTSRDMPIVTKAMSNSIPLLE